MKHVLLLWASLLLYGSVSAHTAPALIYPTAGASAPAGAILNWNAVPGSTAYQVEVDTSAGFNSPLLQRATKPYINSSNNNTDTQHPMLHARFGQRYYWRVRAYVPNDTSAWNSSHFYTTDAILPVSPVNNSQTWAGIMLNWDAHPGVEFYDYQLDTSATFTSPILVSGSHAYINSANSGADTEFLAQRLRFGQKYYWRVRGRHAADTSAWSQLMTFTTRDFTTLVSPNDNAQSYVGVTLDWDAHPIVDFYDYQADTSLNFNSPLFRQGSTSYSTSANSGTDTRANISDLRYGQKYYWRVRARHNTDTSAWTTRSFTTLDYVTLTAPADGAANFPVGVTLDWNAHPGSTFYDYQADTSQLFNSPALLQGSKNYTSSSNSASDSEQLLSRLYFGKKYYWRVRARNNIDTSAWTTRSFSTRNMLALTTPNDNAQTYTGVTLNWDSFPIVDFYDYQADTSQQFNSPMLRQGSTNYVNTSGTYSDTEAAVQNLLFGQKYFWRVRARHNTDTSAWATRSFTTLDYVPLRAPNDGAVNIPVAGTKLNWDAHNGVSFYQVEIDVTNQFNSASLLTATKNYISSNDNNSDTEFLTGTLQPNTTYFWRVRAINTADTSAWTMRAFSTGATVTQVPNAPTLLSPANQAQGQPTSPVLRWSAAASVTHYEYQYDTLATFTTAFTDTTTSATAALSNLKQQQTYFWRVRAYNNNLVSGWSPVWRFSTAMPNGLPEQLAQQLKLYPNPASEQVTLELPEALANEGLRLSVYNAVGQLMLEEALPKGKQQHQLLLKHLPGGLYQLRLNSQNQQHVLRLLVLP